MKILIKVKYLCSESANLRDDTAVAVILREYIMGERFKIYCI